jgi:hypothetical protein
MSSTCVLEVLFANAKTKPTLRTKHFVFTLAPTTGNNPGAIYVKDKDGTYMGKIKNSWFWPSRDYKESDEIRTEILLTMSEPRETAIKYGRETGQCSICGRRLDNALSIFNAIGPICAEKLGFPLQTPPDVNISEL